MTASLCFNDVSLSPVVIDNQPWFSSSEIARALGYAREDTISRLYDRNADEFTENMTQVVENVGTVNLTVTGNLVNKVRIFSLRGCHFLAMFARTPVAKAFRRWVLDVIEQYGDRVSVSDPKEAPSPTGIITQTQRSELKLIVDAKLSTYPAAVQGKARSEVWARHNRHFRIAEYHQLPASRFDESREYLLEMKVNAVAMPAPVQATPAPVPFDSSRLFLNRAKELADLDQRFIQFAGEVRQQFSDFDHEFHRISDGTYAALFRDVSSVRQGSANRVVDALAVQTYDAQGWIDEGLSRMRLAVMSARSANLILADASNAKVTA